MKAVTYKGYAASVEFDPEDGLLVGRLLGINDVVGFHAEGVSELQAAFHEAVDDYIEACAKVGKQPEKPHSGKVMFRIDPATHAKASLAAQMAGKSLNQWAEEKLRSAADSEAGSAVPF